MTTYCLFESCETHRALWNCLSFTAWVALCCAVLCFPPFSQNGNVFKRSFINPTFYSSGTFLVSTGRHARSRASPNTKQIHTKTWFCGNDTFSHWICFLLLFIQNFILLITAWSIIEICKGKEREKEREREREKESERKRERERKRV